jgi:hypothetical protein
MLTTSPSRFRFLPCFFSLATLDITLNRFRLGEPTAATLRFFGLGSDWFWSSRFLAGIATATSVDTYNSRL